MPLYRLYEIERGEIVRHEDFAADSEADAIARARIASDHAEVELWDISAEPIRPVRAMLAAKPAEIGT